MIATAIALLLAGPAADGAAAAQRLRTEQPLRKAALAECYRAAVVRMGAGNAETADTLLRAASATCADQREALYQTYAPDITGPLADAALARDVKEAEDAATAAVLTARAAARP